MNDQREIEVRLHDALNDVAVANVPDSLVPPGLAPAPAPRHGRRLTGALVAASAAVVAIALGGVLVQSHHRTAGPQNVGTSHTTPSSTGVPSEPLVVGSFCGNFVPFRCAHPIYQPLWPYTSYTQAHRYRTGAPASQAWRHSPTAVGRRYLRALGYDGITIHGGDPSPAKGVVGAMYDMVDRAGHVVGGLDLEQYGTTPAAAYEVTGFPTFVHPATFYGLDAPARSARVDGTFAVRGRHATPGAVVRVRTLSLTTVVSTVSVRADKAGHWRATVTAASHGVTTVAAEQPPTRSASARLVIQGFAHA